MLFRSVLVVSVLVRLCLLTAGIGVLPALLFAQSTGGTIEGRVFNTRNGEYLEKARVTYWVADIPFKGPDPRGVPGLLQLQRIDGLHHYLVLDQDERFAEFLRASGARSINSMPVSLDRAVNGFLAKNHATPVAA